MKHTTLNTKDIANFLTPPIFKLKEIKAGQLKPPYKDYEIRDIFLAENNDWFYFDLYFHDSHLSSNAVAKEKNTTAWKSLNELIKVYGIEPIPEPEPPYLATALLPNPIVLKAEFLTNIDQAIASSWMENVKK